MYKKPMNIFERLLILMIVVVLIVAILGSCSPEANAAVDYGDRFVCVTDDTVAYGTYVYSVVDTLTGVTYMIVDGPESVAVTMLVDTSGKPLLWEENNFGY